MPSAIGADVRADRHAHADGAGHRADRAIEHRRAEQMEEAAVHRRALHEAHRAGVRVRAGSPAARRAERAIALEARRDLVERLVPRDALEASLSFRPDAPQRMEQPLAMIGALEVAIHLRAEEAARERVIGIAGELIARPSRTVTSIAHVSGQSCGHAPRTTISLARSSVDLTVTGEDWWRPERCLEATRLAAIITKLVNRKLSHYRITTLRQTQCVVSARHAAREDATIKTSMRAQIDESALCAWRIDLDSVSSGGKITAARSWHSNARARTKDLTQYRPATGDFR